MQICADKRNFLSIFVCLFLNAMIQVIQLKGKDKHLYQLLAPLVMDPDVIRANNNYPFSGRAKKRYLVASAIFYSHGIHT